MVTLLFIASCSSGLRPVCAGEASTCKLNPGTPARLAMAKAAIDSAFRVRPDSGEAHLALSWHLYWGYSDYARARAELALAQQSLPNHAQAFELAGLIDRRQGRWLRPHAISSAHVSSILKISLTLLPSHRPTCG